MPPDGVVTARFHGGPMKGAPTFQVVHDAETPLADAYVASIAQFFQRGPVAGTSAHHMVGPRTWLQLLPEDYVAYAAGPKANPRGVHWEQCGYASFSRAQWLTADGIAQLNRLGAGLMESCVRWNIPVRWCTDAQLRAAALGQPGSGGLSTHEQVARVLGGTTHTDPAPNYPGDLLLAAVLTGGDLDVDLTGKSLQLLQEVRDRVRGQHPAMDSLQTLQYGVDTLVRTLRGEGDPKQGDRLTHLWNQGGEVLASVHLVSGKLDQLAQQVDSIARKVAG